MRSRREPTASAHPPSAKGHSLLAARDRKKAAKEGSALDNGFHRTPDEDGYVGRECPTCQLYFKVRPGTGLTGQDAAFCPYCGESNNLGHFLTKDQLEYAKSIVVGELQKELLAPLKNLPRSLVRGPIGLNVTMTVEGADIPVEHYQERSLETSVTCESCTLDYKIYGIFATCPDCGAHNSKQMLQTSLDLLRHELNDADERTTEDILKNAVSTFDAFGSAATSHHDGTKVSFQNLEHAEQQLQASGHSLRAHTTREEWEFLITAFQKRHVLTHNMGVIDEQYRQRATDPDAIIGRKIRLTKAEVERTIDLLDRIAGLITATTPAPPGTPKARKIGNPYQLTNDALGIAALLFSKDTDGMPLAGMSKDDTQAEVGLDDLPFEAALSELTDHRLVNRHHRWLSSTQYMPLALIDTLDYSPTKDDQLVARIAVEANRQLANREIEKRVGITLQRLNHAIRRLDDKSAVEVTGAIGTAPYAFRSVRATGATLRYLKKFD